MLTLLKFEASWCAPCQAMGPIVKQLDEEDENLIVSCIDIDDNPQERINYHVRSIPTFVLLKDKKEIARKTGSATLGDMKGWINESRDL